LISTVNGRALRRFMYEMILKTARSAAQNAPAAEQHHMAHKLSMSSRASTQMRHSP
jgi:hypothetical protein